MSIDHVALLDKKITALSDALAGLGRGTELKELLRIIRKPGWTTPAEFAFSMALLDGMQAHVAVLAREVTAMVVAARQVSVKEMA